MEAVDVDVVIVIDDQGNVTVEIADDDGETAERHVEEHGVSPILMTHHLKLTVPVPTAAVQKGPITPGSPGEFKLFKG